MQGKNNPQELLNKMFSSYNNEQIKNFKQFANGFGISEEQLNKYISKPN